MTDNPLYISFVWHMHQPYYKDPSTDVYRLPWVRLHGTKDYLDMLEILKEFPAIKQNFNLVPSLLEQLIDYTENNARDSYLEASRRKVSDLSNADKMFILENFFLANWETMIRPFPRYYELLVKRGTHSSRETLRAGSSISRSRFSRSSGVLQSLLIDPFSGRTMLF
jgi:alpha-amylase/alpha-mannosidase (GH57 family)